jgi:hypothetical protein
MNRFTRMLAIAGMGLGAAVALAGPAQAATADASHQAPVATKADWGNGDRIVGFYDDPFTCNRVGRLGELRGRWDDYDCNPVRFGFHRGDWALSVSEDDWSGPFNHGGPFHHGGHFGDHGDHFGDHGGPIRGHFPFQPSHR